jgi:hypothetical protein
MRKNELGVSYTGDVTGRVRTSALQRLDQPAAVLVVIMRVRVSSEDPMRVRVRIRRLVVMAFALSNRVSSWRFPFVGAVAVYPPSCHLHQLVVSV